MNRFKTMEEALMNCVQSQMTHLETVDAKELGEVIDMIKDLEEAMYYCTITEAMHKKEEGPHYYTDYRYPDYRDMDRKDGRMYYNGNGDAASDTRYYHGGFRPDRTPSHWPEIGDYEERPLHIMRDHREGRAGMSRKSYMETKEMHHDKGMQMKELEKYMQELSHDVIEMISDASPEEKQMLQQRISALAAKIQ